MNLSYRLFSVAAVFAAGSVALHAQSSTNAVSKATSSKTPPPAAVAPAAVNPPPSTPASTVPAATTPAAATAVPESEVPVQAKKDSLKALDQKGKISAIDVNAGTFTVEGKNFTFVKRGKVFIDGVKMALGDLKDGDLVAVSYFEKAEGVNSAFRIFKGSRGHKKSKSSKKSASSDSTDVPATDTVK